MVNVPSAMLHGMPETSGHVGPFLLGLGLVVQARGAIFHRASSRGVLDNRQQQRDGRN